MLARLPRRCDLSRGQHSAGMDQLHPVECDLVRGAPGRLRRSDGEPVGALGGARRVGRVAAPAPQEWRKLLGRKVSLRARNPGSDGPPFTEAIGMVQSVAADDQGYESVVV